VAVVVVQWANLIICKTRYVSLLEKGMKNGALNFGLVFMTILAAILCYSPGMIDSLHLYPIK
jgi:sodium/potassium-transporting ATPase subunit alpha